MTRQLEFISTKVRNLEGTKNSHTYLGKKVFSKSGNYVGKVREIMFRDDALSGLIVSGKARVFVDREYIASDSGTAVMLGIDPVILMLGKQVFDSEGRKLGKVTGLDRKSTANTFSAIMVKRNIFTKPFMVANGDISVTKTNIITKTAFER
jgi:sporulation protein YlmC with PRC-barrel domain